MIERRGHRRRNGAIRPPCRDQPTIPCRGRVARPGGPVTFAGVTLDVEPTQHCRMQRGVDPARQIARMRGRHGQALDEPAPGRLGLPLELQQFRPGRLGVHMIGRHRGHATPVVQTCGDQRAQRAGTQVGGRLDRHARAEDPPRHGDRPEQLIEAGLGMARHARAGLGAEILDDDFLDVPVSQMQGADREQRLDALPAGLADPDQDARGEWHLLLTGRLQRREAGRRMLVRGPVMRAAPLREPRRNALEHDAHGHGHGPQGCDVGRRHDSGVEVRQQSGLDVDQTGAVREILQRGREPQRAQLLARHAVAQFRLVAQREEGFVTPGTRSGTSHLEHLVGRHERARAFARRSGESAVVTDVAAQLRERDEHLAGIAHALPEPGHRKFRGPAHQRRQVVFVGQQQRLLGGHRLAVEVGGQVDIVRQPGCVDHDDAQPGRTGGIPVRARAALAVLRRDTWRQPQPQGVGALAPPVGNDADIGIAGRSDDAIDLFGGDLWRIGRNDERRVGSPRHALQRQRHRGVEPHARVVDHVYPRGQGEPQVGRHHDDARHRARLPEREQHALQHALHERSAPQRRQDSGKPGLALARCPHRHDRDRPHSGAPRCRCRNPPANSSVAAASRSRSSSERMRVCVASTGRSSAQAAAASS